MTSVNRSKHQHKECHCGFSRQFDKIRAKTGRRLGILGAVIMVAHFLFHVVECLLLPAILVGLGGHITEEDALATSEDIIMETINVDNTHCDNFINWNFYKAQELLSLNQSDHLRLGGF